MVPSDGISKAFLKIGFSLIFGLSSNFVMSDLSCIPKNVTFVYNDPITVRTTQFCFSLSKKFQCSELTEVLVPTNGTLTKCCPGFKIKNENGVLKCMCSRCPPNMRCDADSGDCICEDGWIGKYCDIPCPKLQFGPRCEKKCDSGPNTYDCHSVTGTQICFPGFYGDMCENPCPKGMYCIDGMLCKRASNCKCPPGRIGSFCERKTSQLVQDSVLEAINKTDHRISCMKKGEWDEDRGRCVCKPGWQGKSCEKKCDHGYYGMDCSNKCPTLSKDSHISSRKNPSCNPTTGFYECEVGFKGIICDACSTCDCPPGYEGEDCNTNCPQGRYGANCRHNCSCQNNGTCSPIDGTCTCSAGWSGVQCENTCESGYYGVNCRSRCELVGHYEECDPVTGKLLCLPGYTGALCNETCPRERFGKNCQGLCESKCNGTCSILTGECLNDDHTKSKVIATPSVLMGFFQRNLWPMIFLVVSLTAFVSVNLIVVLGQRSQRRNKDCLLADSHNYIQYCGKNKLSKEEGHQYEEVGVYEQGDTYDHLDLQKQRQSFHLNYENCNGKFNLWHIQK